MVLGVRSLQTFFSSTPHCSSLPNLVFPSNTPCKDHIFRHQGHSLGMNGAEKTVLEEGHHVGFSGLLESHDSCGLEPQVFGTNLTTDLSNDSGKWQLRN